MNIQEATPIDLTERERSALEAMIRSPKTEHGIVERARIVLLAAGRSTRSIADELATWPGAGQPMAHALCARALGWAARSAAARADTNYAIDGYADDMLSDLVYSVERDLEHESEEGSAPCTRVCLPVLSQLPFEGTQAAFPIQCGFLLLCRQSRRRRGSLRSIPRLSLQSDHLRTDGALNFPVIVLRIYTYCRYGSSR
jgi:hypothetical protein